ncbi:PREDICTED: uncharacterized protein LOC105570454 [Vollenhovia emeryi]|uniref:uncharacterized protein LOC105570454 n=1 Tax=Vollenhovia emeryi TaxID=411798 RepID=UPI0005F4E292|nr:PREDICTED: uncharacterized protein LOC105570454 [Vollenhovia emeryi]
MFNAPFIPYLLTLNTIFSNETFDDNEKAEYTFDFNTTIISNKNITKWSNQPFQIEELTGTLICLSYITSKKMACLISTIYSLKIMKSSEEASGRTVKEKDIFELNQWIMIHFNKYGVEKLLVTPAVIDSKYQKVKQTVIESIVEQFDTNTVLIAELFNAKSSHHLIQRNLTITTSEGTPTDQCTIQYQMNMQNEQINEDRGYRSYRIIPVRVAENFPNLTDVRTRISNIKRNCGVTYDIVHLSIRKKADIHTWTMEMSNNKLNICSRIDVKIPNSDNSYVWRKETQLLLNDVRYPVTGTFMYSWFDYEL